MKKIDHVILSGTKCSRRISTYLFFSVLVAFLAGCDDSSSASAENNEPTALSSAEERGNSSSETNGADISSGVIQSSSANTGQAPLSAELDGAESSSSSEQNVESSSSEKLFETGGNSAGEVELSSGSVKKTSWDYLNPDIDYSEFVDIRDGQVYKTVQIGEQVWMAQNLNYQTKKSWCGGGRDKTEGDCAIYGRLYTWAVAIGKTEDECGYGHNCDQGSGNVQGVCPDGWHLPSKIEWETLFAAVGGQSTAGLELKASSGWENELNGNDSYGFSALPAGCKDSGYFLSTGQNPYFWSATPLGSIDAYYVYLRLYHDYVVLDHHYKYNAFSVRCLQD